MNYEQKYKDALKRAKKLYEQGTITESLGYVFPELQEDERIRKALIEMIHDTTGDECEDCYHVSKENVLSWLEKQGEKKNTREREIDDAYLQGMCDAKHEFEKQGEQPTDKIEPTPAWSEEDEEMLMWLCRIIHSQRMRKEITLKEESELGEWMDKWLNHNPQTKQGKQLDADNVLLQNYISNVTCLINQIKKDFGL